MSVPNPVTFRVTPERHRRLEKVAHQHGLTINEATKEAIETLLKKDEIYD